jgi:hypothetical protein
MSMIGVQAPRSMQHPQHAFNQLPLQQHTIVDNSNNNHDNNNTNNNNNNFSKHHVLNQTSTIDNSKNSELLLLRFDALEVFFA